MNRNHHRILAILAFICLAPLSASCQSKVQNAGEVPPFDAAKRLEGTTLSFFVIGDWGSGTQPQRDVAKSMIKKYAEDGADAVLTCGDNFYPDGVSSVTDALWDIRFENTYPESEFPIPFYPTLGNHDRRGDPEAQVQYTQTVLDNGKPTRWTMNGLYWTHVFSSLDGDVTVRVTGLDTQPLISGTKEEKDNQITWLENVLSSADEDWNIVIGHHPVYSNGIHGNTLSMIMQVKPLFEKHGVEVYFAGHDHDLQLLKPKNNVHYVVSGGGGQTRSTHWADNTVFAATNYGFVWVQLNEAEMLVQFLGRDGEVLYATTIPNRQ